MQIGRAVQQECGDRDLHSFPTRRSSDLSISRWITASSSCKRCCLFVCRALSSKRQNLFQELDADRKSGSAGMRRPRSTLFPYTTLFRSFHKQMDNRIKLLEEILSFRMQGVEFEKTESLPRA